MTDLTTPTEQTLADSTPTATSEPVMTDSYQGVREQISDFYKEIWETSRFVIHTKDSYRATIILWIFLTYLRGHVKYAPILVLDAKGRGCGKTTLQKFLAVMCGQSANERFTDFTKAGLKKIAGTPSVIFLDEFDQATPSMVKSVSSFLNSRFEESGGQTLTASEIRDVFGFTCVSGIGCLSKLEDSTQSRCIRLVSEQPEQGVKLRKTFDGLPLTQLFALANNMKEFFEQNSEQLQHYFHYVVYPQQDVLLGRFGDVWRELFNLATLIGEECVKDLMNCVLKQSHLDTDIDFPTVQYSVMVRQYKVEKEVLYYDEKDRDDDRSSTDYSTNDFLTGLKAVLDLWHSQSTIGIQTKELFRLLSILNIKGLPLTQRALGRHMNSLGFTFNKNVDKSSGYRFDHCFEVLSQKYSNSVYEDLLGEYTVKLEPHL